MATIKDVAKEAGVSVTTVSRVINNKGVADQEMVRRVKEAMKLLNYQPNDMARSLALKRTHMIGLIALRADLPFYSRLIQSIENKCSQSNYKLLLCTSDGDLVKETALSSMLRANKVDGILLAGWVKDSSAFTQYDMPVVTIERTIDEFVPMVTCDNFGGGQLAARTLIENGCKHPVVFSGISEIESPISIREAGFESECERLGVKCIKFPLSKLPKQGERYMDMFTELFSEYPEADGIFGSDNIAAMCKAACLQLGIDVPGKVRIIGFDGLDIAEMLDITTIAQPIEAMGASAVELLLKRIAREPTPKKLTLPVELIKRKTTS